MSPFKRKNLIKHLTCIGILSLALFFGLMQIKPSIFVFLFIVINNIYLFFLVGADKKAAKEGEKRTPESTFLTLAFLGAFPALFYGRKIFRHKTIKKDFIYPMWALFILQIALIGYALYSL